LSVHRRLDRYAEIRIGQARENGLKHSQKAYINPGHLMMPVKFWVFFALTALFSTYNGMHCRVKNALSAQKIPQKRLDTQMSTEPSVTQMYD
jgi:hypothetical protein